MGDLFLDNPMYNAGATGTDAWWAGVPTLTLPGDRVVSRMSASLATGMGLGTEVSEGGAVSNGDPPMVVHSRKVLFYLNLCYSFSDTL